MRQEDVVAYYDTCEFDYRLLWDLNHSLAMHMGYWDETTKSLRDALRRENEILAEMAHIKAGERVLDAGCGVGGSSIFLAKRYQCEVTGVTLSDKQVQTATENALAAGVSHIVRFEKMDYTATRFPDDHFDVIWGIESICHAQDKRDFIREAARILKPKGRLIIADGFAVSSPMTSQDAALMQRWLKGWGVEALETVHAFQQALISEGFQRAAFKNINAHIWPSVKRLYLYAQMLWFPFKLAEWLRLRSSLQTENIDAAYCQYKAFKKGLAEYGIFYAEKEG
jgi:tocopherol O-methyltransferase